MKNFFLTIGTTAFAVIMAVNLNVGLNKTARMDVVLADIEALAQNESYVQPGSITALTTGLDFGGQSRFKNTGNVVPSCVTITNWPGMITGGDAISSALEVSQGVDNSPSNDNRNFGILTRLHGSNTRGAAILASSYTNGIYDYFKANHLINDRYAGYFYGTVYMSGNVGIAKLEPEYPLDVDGDIRAENVPILSDLRLKTNVKSLGTSMDQISRLRPVTYNLKPKDLSRYYALLPDSVSVSDDEELRSFFGLRKVDEKRKRIGFIAQEIQEVFPELVHEDSKGMLSVNYISLIPVLVGAIQEQTSINQALNETVQMQNEAIAALIKRLEALEKGAGVGGGGAQGSAPVQDFSFSLFPNPANGFVTVDYTMYVDAPICIELYNTFGQRLKMIVPKQNQMAGTYSAQTSVAGLNAGAYIVRATSGEQIDSKQLVVNY